VGPHVRFYACFVTSTSGHATRCFGQLRFNAWEKEAHHARSGGCRLREEEIYREGKDEDSCEEDPTTPCGPAIVVTYGIPQVVHKAVGHFVIVVVVVVVVV